MGFTGTISQVYCRYISIGRYAKKHEQVFKAWLQFLNNQI